MAYHQQQHNYRQKFQGDQPPQQQRNHQDHIMALWENVSAKGHTYYTGTTSLGEKVIGFISINKTNENQPDLRIYYKKDLDSREGERHSNTNQEDVPF